ncbi:MAG: Nif3-like dinuclear metal center hexameric protein [bacterium]
MDRDRLVEFLDRLLAVDSMTDFGPQGLQVEGKREIRRVVVGVSASAELFRRAIAAGADLVICHHGLLWGSPMPVVRGSIKERLELLLKHEITLLGYHLVLDAHEEHGNNALLARALGLVDVQPFGEFRGTKIGRKGRFPTPIARASLGEAIARVTGGEPLVFAFGPDPVRTIGIMSGGAPDEFRQAKAEGLDAYMTGEAREHIQELTREERITFVAAGHYRTETFGVRSLGERITREFGIPCEFVDVPNPV